MTNFTNSVIYVGVTSNLVKRAYQHKNKIYDGFTASYYVNKLVYFEEYSDPENAIKREKQIKGGSRQDKINLIIKENPNFKDLYPNLIA
ncbi:MAG: GIY-YIG nuclease family protein [bacterium]|nr:GIY-YIG nuclease family protein [bacterium]